MIIRPFLHGCKLQLRKNICTQRTTIEVTLTELFHLWREPYTCLSKIIKIFKVLKLWPCHIYTTNSGPLIPRFTAPLACCLQFTRESAVISLTYPVSSALV